MDPITKTEKMRFDWRGFDNFKIAKYFMTWPINKKIKHKLLSIFMMFYFNNEDE